MSENVVFKKITPTEPPADEWVLVRWKSMPNDMPGSFWLLPIVAQRRAFGMQAGFWDGKRMWWEPTHYCPIPLIQSET